MTTDFAPKIRQFLNCNSCNYVCSKKSDYTRHCLSRKHKNTTICALIQPEKRQTFICSCTKSYTHRSSLFNHKKTCKSCVDITVHEDGVINDGDISIKSDLKQLTNIVIELVKSNSDLQKQLVDAYKNNNNINSNNTHINSHNKTFNLQFFLNEQCKDAMNISDFVNTFDLKLSDLESVGSLGYVEGMSKIFLDKLSSMDIYKRPMHCSDARREIIYIKDENKWEKEHINNPKLHCAIKTLSFKNMKLTNVWSDTYPESKASESHLNDVYMKLVFQSTGGKGDIADNENKIIRRIAKELVIDKKLMNI
jgi:hypothetical protein